MGYGNGLSYADAELLSQYNKAIKGVNSHLIKDRFNDYNNIVTSKMLANRIIPYNSILTLTIKLFKDFPQINEFYQKYFRAILVDEYQDTNYLGYQLISCLITEETKVLLLGDLLQRIYGFIGAVPDLLTKSERIFNLTKIQLETNHRFASNPQMLKLDFNIRQNAENPFAPKIKENALINLEIVSSQSEELVLVIKKALSLIQENRKSKVAILVKQRSFNIQMIMETFEENHLPYFYSLFTDEDLAYVQFHRNCYFEFLKLLVEKGQVTRKLKWVSYRYNK